MKEMSAQHPWASLQHMQKHEVEERLGRGLHLPVVVRVLPVRSCVDSFVEQCDLPRRRQPLLLGKGFRHFLHPGSLRADSSCRGREKDNMRRKRVYEVCLNVFSSVCILELRVTHAKYSHALSISFIHTHTQAPSSNLANLGSGAPSASVSSRARLTPATSLGSSSSSRSFMSPD